MECQCARGGTESWWRAQTQPCPGGTYNLRSRQTSSSGTGLALGEAMGGTQDSCLKGVYRLCSSLWTWHAHFTDEEMEACGYWLINGKNKTQTVSSGSRLMFLPLLKVILLEGSFSLPVKFETCIFGKGSRFPLGLSFLLLDSLFQQKSSARSWKGVRSSNLGEKTQLPS